MTDRSGQFRPSEPPRYSWETKRELTPGPAQGHSASLLTRKLCHALATGGRCLMESRTVVQKLQRLSPITLRSPSTWPPW